VKKKNPRSIVSAVLQRVEEGAYSNIALDSALKSAALSPADRRLVTRVVYGTISNIRLIDALWEQVHADFAQNTDPFMRATLRAALYQLRFLDRVPAHAVIKTSVDVIKFKRGMKAAGFCNALLRKILPIAKGELPSLGDALKDFAVRESLSDDLAKLLWDQFGASLAQKIAQSYNETPKNSMRVNLAKVSIDALAKELEAERSSLVPAGLLVQRFEQKLKDALSQNLCAVQDEGAQLVSLALGDFNALVRAEDGRLSVWDACAGQGGKAMHLMDIAQSQSLQMQLVCTDLFENKLERLRHEQKRAFPAQALYTRAMDLTAGGSISHAPFSGIVLDAPCSGLGVLRRHPEGKWSKTLDDIHSLAELQKTLLKQVSKHLRVGGILIYAVCTLTKEETTSQIESFLQEQPNFKLSPLPPVIAIAKGAPMLQILPHEYHCDGFFIARLQRES